MEPNLNQSLRILLVEDHATLARLTAELIEELGCALVGPARCVREALQLAQVHPIDVALVDLSLPDGTGADLIDRLRDMGIRCAVLSAWCRDDIPSLVPSDVAWLEKPLSIQDLRKIITETKPRN